MEQVQREREVRARDASESGFLGGAMEWSLESMCSK